MPRNIFITGGMGGIGQSCVRKFIAQGDLVTFTFAEDKANFAAAEKFAESCTLSQAEWAASASRVFANLLPKVI